MRIIKKETIELSEREADAFSLVLDIYTGLMREANDPDLEKLAKETYEKITELWEWKE